MVWRWVVSVTRRQGSYFVCFKSKVEIWNVFRDILSLENMLPMYNFVDVLNFEMY